MVKIEPVASFILIIQEKHQRSLIWRNVQVIGVDCIIEKEMLFRHCTIYMGIKNLIWLLGLHSDLCLEFV